MNDQWLVPREAIIISMSSIKAQLDHEIRTYWSMHGWLSPESMELTRQHGAVLMDDEIREIVDHVVAVLLRELFTEKQSDMRNADELEQTERSLTEYARFDERSCHRVAEDLFASVVNLLGMHLPHITFSNHDGYQFKVMRHDLLIYKQ